MTEYERKTGRHMRPRIDGTRIVWHPIITFLDWHYGLIAFVVPGGMTPEQIAHRIANIRRIAHRGGVKS
jgi:hypothetical protein